MFEDDNLDYKFVKDPADFGKVVLSTVVTTLEQPRLVGMTPGRNSSLISGLAVEGVPAPAFSFVTEVRSVRG